MIVTGGETNVNLKFLREIETVGYTGSGAEGLPILVGLEAHLTTNGEVTFPPAVYQHIVECTDATESEAAIPRVDTAEDGDDHGTLGPLILNSVSLYGHAHANDGNCKNSNDFFHNEVSF